MRAPVKGPVPAGTPRFRFGVVHRGQAEGVPAEPVLGRAGDPQVHQGSIARGGDRADVGDGLGRDHGRLGQRGERNLLAAVNNRTRDRVDGVGPDIIGGVGQQARHERNKRADGFGRPFFGFPVGWVVNGRCRFRCSSKPRAVPGWEPPDPRWCRCLWPWWHRYPSRPGSSPPDPSGS